MPAATASSRRATGGHTIKMLVPEGERSRRDERISASIPRARAVYEDGWMVT